MEAKDERERVLRAQAGDRAAFEDLIRDHARLVWACAYGVVRDAGWTEDLVQETFLRAWESRRELKEPEAFRAWLLTIAKRLAWHRAELSGRPLPEPTPPEKAGAADPEEAREAAREEVQRALARLPERYRVPVTLHFLNGLEYGAIEQLTGLANGSLRGLVARGVAKLRAELAPWWRSRHERA